MIVIVTGWPREIKRWAKEHGLTEKDYIRTSYNLDRFPPGTDYVTVGEWVRCYPSNMFIDVRRGAYEAICAAENADLHFRGDLSE